VKVKEITTIRLGREGWTKLNKQQMREALGMEKEEKENRNNGSAAAQRKIKTTISSIMMPKELVEKLRAESLEHKVSLKDIVRKALEDYVNAH
jgi:hypothetical protein